jgi:hypothetical protein
MFFEKLDITVDIDRLRKDVEQHVFTLGDPIFQGDEYGYDNFGGWSLLTRTGNWRDGWEIGHTGHPGEKIIFPDGKPNYRVSKFLNISHSFEHANPTEGYQGEIARVLDQIRDQGFTPRRARVSLLRPGGATLLHSDTTPNVYMARIHIPLWTNEQCIHRCEDYDLHMPADGSVYILWVNRDHQVTNKSAENRYHIIMDAYDTKGVTENFKFIGDIDNLQRDATSFRQNIDAVTLSEQEIHDFESLRKQFLK